MEMHPQNDIDGRARDSKSVLRWMTSEQLLDLGMNQVVYLKSGMCHGKMVFVLFGADGTPSAILIDAAGKVASDVRVGAAEVLALAGAVPAAAMESR